MGFRSKCSILNGQVIYIEKSKLKIADMWLIHVTFYLTNNVWLLLISMVSYQVIYLIMGLCVIHILHFLQIKDVIQYGQNFLKCFEISWKKMFSYSFVHSRISKISWKITSLPSTICHRSNLQSWSCQTIFGHIISSQSHLKELSRNRVMKKNKRRGPW